MTRYIHNKLKTKFLRRKEYYLFVSNKKDNSNVDDLVTRKCVDQIHQQRSPNLSKPIKMFVISKRASNVESVDVRHVRLRHDQPTKYLTHSLPP